MHPDNAACNASKDYVLSKQLVLAPTCRYSTRSTIAKAANATQVDQKQFTNPSPVAHDYPIDCMETPDQLKYAELIKGPGKAIWEKGMCNEIGCLAQGHGDVQGKNTTFFIHWNKVPKIRESHVVKSFMLLDLRKLKLIEFV